MLRIKQVLATILFFGILGGAVWLRDMAFRDLPATVDWAFRLSHGL